MPQFDKIKIKKSIYQTSVFVNISEIKMRLPTIKVIIKMNSKHLT